jgi:dTDP-4-dehydrorhamnose reductase
MHKLTDKPMKICVTGVLGNIGSRLLRELQARGHDVIGTDIHEVDICDFDAIGQYIAAAQPGLVIHCAALTNVDRCAEQPDEALRINALGTQNIALVCQRLGSAMCYLSTNEVFDGERGAAYMEYDSPRPINPYGYSKWVGEQIVRSLLPQHYIVRTSWVFAHTGQNFLQKIMSKAAAGQPLSVVANEVASPTYAEDLVPALAQLVDTGRYGIYHLVNEGRTSRYDFARHILDCYGFPDYPISKITSAQYPRPSRPPVYSALTNFFAAQMGIRLRPWTEAVAAFVEREKTAAAESR